MNIFNSYNTFLNINFVYCGRVLFYNLFSLVVFTGHFDSHTPSPPPPPPGVGTPINLGYIKISAVRSLADICFLHVL